MTDPNKPMDREYEERLRSYLDGDLDSEPPWDGRDGMECTLAYVLRAHDYWRARALVEESDLGDVTAAHVLAYLRSHDWSKEDPTNDWSWTSPGPHPHVVYIGADDPDLHDVVMAIAGIASHERRAQFDVLDEMARVDDDEPDDEPPPARKGQASLF